MEDASPAFRLARKIAESASPQAPKLLAVDGRCGSGKTTLARQLAEAFGCAVFHMDDFFLPPALRTPERLAVPGENVHHERFLQEVLLPFVKGRPVCFRPFDCARGDFGAPLCFTAAPFAIVEGSYSLHPALRELYAGSVFVTCAYDVRLARLTARGAQTAVFEQKWIPLEESYFRAFAVEAYATLTIDTSAAPPVRESEN